LIKNSEGDSLNSDSLSSDLKLNKRIKTEEETEYHSLPDMKERKSCSSSSCNTTTGSPKRVEEPPAFDSKVKGLSTPRALTLSQANTASTCTTNKTINLCPTEVQKPGAVVVQRPKACMRNLNAQMSNVQHVMRPAP